MLDFVVWIDLPGAKERYTQLASRFRECFGHSPDAFARSPGECVLQESIWHVCVAYMLSRKGGCSWGKVMC